MDRLHQGEQRAIAAKSYRLIAEFIHRCDCCLFHTVHRVVQRAAIDTKEPPGTVVIVAVLSALLAEPCHHTRAQQRGLADAGTAKEHDYGVILDHLDERASVFLPSEEEVHVLNIEVVQEAIGSATEQCKIPFPSAGARSASVEALVQLGHEIVECAGLATDEVPCRRPCREQADDFRLVAVVLDACRALDLQFVEMSLVADGHEPVDPEYPATVTGDMIEEGPVAVVVGGDDREGLEDVSDDVGDGGIRRRYLFGGEREELAFDVAAALDDAHAA